MRVIERTASSKDMHALMTRLYGTSEEPKPREERPANGAVYVLSAASDIERIRYVGSTRDWGRRIYEHRYTNTGTTALVKVWRDGLLAGDSVAFGIVLFGDDRKQLYHAEHDLLGLCQSYGMADLHRAVRTTRRQAA